MGILDKDREKHLDHNRILSHQNVYARATWSQIGNLDCDDRIRPALCHEPNQDNPVQTYLVVSEGETRLWQIVSSEIEQY